MAGLVLLVDFKPLKVRIALDLAFLVAYLSYLSHQALHEQVDVVGVDVWLHHWCISAGFAVLTEQPRLYNASPFFQAHDQNNLHQVRRPGSFTQVTSKPSKTTKGTGFQIYSKPNHHSTTLHTSNTITTKKNKETHSPAGVM